MLLGLYPRQAGIVNPPQSDVQSLQNRISAQSEDVAFQPSHQYRPRLHTSSDSCSLRLCRVRLSQLLLTIILAQTACWRRRRLEMPAGRYPETRHRPARTHVTPAVSSQANTQPTSRWSTTKHTNQIQTTLTLETVPYRAIPCHWYATKLCYAVPSHVAPDQTRPDQPKPREAKMPTV
jgi:hypothetical protein